MDIGRLSDKTRKGSTAVQGQCPSLIRQHLLFDSVEYGVVVVKFEVVWLCLGVLLIYGKLKAFF
jgi:hypothetical protein